VLVYGVKKIFLGKLGDLLFPALILVNFLNSTLIIFIQRLWNTIMA